MVAQKTRLGRMPRGLVLLRLVRALFTSSEDVNERGYTHCPTRYKRGSTTTKAMAARLHVSGDI